MKLEEMQYMKMLIVMILSRSIMKHSDLAARTYVYYPLNIVIIFMLCLLVCMCVINGIFITCLIFCCSNL